MSGRRPPSRAGRLRRTLAAILAAGASACADPNGDAPGADRGSSPVVRDSAGVTIVEHPLFDPDTLQMIRWGPEPVLDIGRVEGVEGYLLAGVISATRLEDGSILVSSGRDVRLFDAAGRHLWTQGRLGAGPGEYRRAVMAFRVSGDSIAVWDGSERMLTVLAPDGRYVAERTIVVDGRRLRTMRTPSADGALRFWSARQVESPGPEGLTRVETWMRVVEVDLGGAVVARSAERRTGISYRDGYTQPPPFFARGTFADVPYGPLWWGDARFAQATLGELGGDPTLIVRWRTPDRTLTREHRDEWSEWALQYYGGIPSEDPALVEEALDFIVRLPFPERLPAFYGLTTDQAGRLWVRDYQSRDQEWDGVYRFTVFSADGLEILGRLKFARPTRVLDAGEDWILLLERDDFDVDYIRLYPFVVDDS